MSYTTLNSGVGEHSGSLCMINGDEDLRLRSGGAAIWNALKPCVNKHLSYSTQKEIESLWLCNGNAWKSVAQSVVANLFAICPSGIISVANQITNYPTNHGTIKLSSGLARQVWKISQGQGYKILWGAILTLIRNCFMLKVEL